MEVKRGCVRGLVAVLAFWFGAFDVVPLAAEAGNPSDLVTEFMIKTKTMRSPVGVIDYVDWESAFAAASDAERAKFGVKTPADLERYYRRVLEDPERFTREEVSRQLLLVPPDKRSIVEKQLEEALVQVRMKQDRLREFYRGLTFEVGKATVQGDTATVPLSTTVGGETTENMVTLINKNGQWKLPSVEFARPVGSGKKNNAPAAGAAPPVDS